MKKQLIIFGANDLGRLLKYYLESDNDSRKIISFTMDQEYITNDVFCGLPVIPFESIEKYASPDDTEILLAIGNRRMNQIREDIFNKCKQKGYTVASFIHSSCSVHSSDIGEGNIMLENCLIYPFSKIGKGNLMWDHVLVSHDCSVGDFNTFSSYADLCGYVNIMNNGFFGKHCVINEHTSISSYTLVGADAYVKNDTKEYDVVVPQRSIVLEKKSTDIV